MSTAPRGDIAIVGMAGMFPGAPDVRRFWSNICAKLDFTGDPPPQWEAERYLNAAGPTHIPTARGGYLGEDFAADPIALGVMPSSVDGSEPDHFIALRVAQAALDDVRAMEGIDRTRMGVILGHSTYLHRGNAAVVQHGVVLDQTREILGQLMPWADPATLDRVRAEMAERLPPFNADIAPGLVPNVMTGRIANKLDLQGPNYILDAACSSSILSVLSAMAELRAGRSDVMLAGGVNASISAEVYMVFNQLGALSKQGRVRPFSEGGDGTLLGEGLGILALKRREDAEAQGDRIYAVIRGTGQSSDGRGSGLLAPRLEGEILAIRRAIEDAGTEETPPQLIEAHGTGIELGDRTEISALRDVFGARAGSGLPSIAIGSVKSMIGHCIPAAGAAGLIKTSLALYHRTLPPTICDEVRGALSMDETPLYVSTEARPWIMAPDAPRRAAVNAFGFGGVNSHAVLEEAPAPDGAPFGATPSHWPHELVLLRDETTTALAASARALIARIEARPDASLSQIAAHAAAQAGQGDCRLAIVASDPADLTVKLGKAAERLAAGKGSFRVKGGTVASDAPTDGKLAFLFPGEGAQYQGMLGGILTAFPEARSWFDFWDGLFPEREMPPSASVFPPPTTLSPELSKELGERLFGLELGSEGMFVASQALMAVTERMGLSPDLVVGHSSGEHSALAAAGVLGETGSAESRAEFAGRIRSLNDLYRRIEDSGGIGGGALLTVGGVPRARILELVEASGGELHLALDNCEHQAVLYGTRARMEEVVDTLRPEGGMTAFLPFDRPYHTPLFGDVAAQVEGVYEGMEFAAPRLPVYSCATAAPMPGDPSEIRALAAKQWASRVRFTETVERLWEDGVRVFLEVGPSSNLTGFAEDTLKGRGALVLGLDSRRRGGLAHLLATLGRLWVAGVPMTPAALFEGRELTPLDLEADRPKRGPRHIDNTLAIVRLPGEVAAEISAELAAQAGVTAAPEAAAPAAPPMPAAPVEDAAPAAAPAPPETPDAAPEPALPLAAGEADPSLMGGHFDVMQRFLDMSGTVMEAAMGAAPAAPAEEAVAEPGEWSPPLLHRIEADGESLRAESDFDPLTDPFIAHHTLYADVVSDSDPDLQSLPVLPLAVSMEMVLEAAAALTGQVPTRLENVAARDWIAFDHGPATIATVAERREGRVAVRLMRGEALLFEAEAVLSEDDLPPLLPALQAPQPPVWSDDALYSTGMFHGPLFQGIASLTGWDGGGLDARLADLPLGDFFAHGEAPEGLLINPALLDQVGHVTAFWIAQGWGTDFSSFPSSIARIDLPGARAEALAGGRIAGRLGFRDASDMPVAVPSEARFLQGDFDAVDAAGERLLSVRGWRDRFFDVPHNFYEARYRPREAWYGQDARGLFPGAAPDLRIWRVPAFPRGFLEDAGGLWTRVLAATILSATEREVFAGLTGKRRRDWIMGRIALKEAARAWMLGAHGLALLPADLEIVPDAEGRPTLDPSRPEWLGIAGPMPELALSHAGGEAIAVAAPAGRRVGIDMEVPQGVSADLLAEGAFDAGELGRMGVNGDASAALGRLLAGWCAKEAAAKMLGEGLTGRPKSFVLSRMDGIDAEIRPPAGPAVQVRLAHLGEAVLALADD